MNVENTTLHQELDARSAVPKRRRSDGILSAKQCEWHRANDIPLAYDPLQNGWVPVSSDDDLQSAAPVDSRLVFRKWEADDAPTLAAMLSSERLWRHLPERYQGPVSQDAALELIDVSHADHHLVLAVTRNDVPVGQVRLLFSQPDAAEISYWFGEAYWGNGYASDVVRRFSDQCLRDRPDLDRLFAVVHTGNPASRRVLSKAAFRPVSDDGTWLTLERCRTRS